MYLTSGLEVKGHKVQCQRSPGSRAKVKVVGQRSRSAYEKKNRQVGSQQRQVASLLSGKGSVNFLDKELDVVLACVFESSHLTLTKLSQLSSHNKINDCMSSSFAITNLSLTTLLTTMSVRLKWLRGIRERGQNHPLEKIFLTFDVIHNWTGTGK